ncbi:hypothetical protein CXF86_11095 [Shewanella sp. GutCb]|uniref:hypothetical protein n=1 Tax=Shewanella sp. GutCb TaxID=2058315 RepID=UPI000C7E3141|nr:hypothetical protein [Shewanella sp. GutCb]PKG74828.1 hypothetical protein CXF86_11095 [Shewanella sp. GutCb]
MNLDALLSTNIIIPIVVAFIGFLIAVTTAVIAKEHKVSEFRQAWIDALREDLAKFYSTNYQLSNILIESKGNIGNKDTAISDFKQNCIEFDELSCRISLRLNWDEHKELKNNIDELQVFREQVSVKSTDFSPLEPLLNKFKKLSKDILSTEWQVVKDGETLFLKFKYVSKLLATTFLVSMFVLLEIGIMKSSIFQW